MAFQIVFNSSLQILDFKYYSPTFSGPFVFVRHHVPENYFVYFSTSRSHCAEILNHLTISLSLKQEKTLKG